MIGRLEGRLHRVEPGTVLVDVGGVGYQVATTLREFDRLKDGDSAVLWIHTQVRDDAIVLFGFEDRRDLDAFEKLIAVAGVGPRTALAVLSGMTAGELATAVERGDLALLQRSPGVGRKTAERILLELKDRLETPGSSPVTTRGDAVSALVNLGYSQRDATRAVDAVSKDGEAEDLGDILRQALQQLTR